MSPPINEDFDINSLFVCSFAGNHNPDEVLEGTFIYNMPIASLSVSLFCTFSLLCAVVELLPPGDLLASMYLPPVYNQEAFLHKRLPAIKAPIIVHILRKALLYDLSLVMFVDYFVKKKQNKKK